MTAQGTTKVKKRFARLTAAGATLTVLTALALGTAGSAGASVAPPGGGGGGGGGVQRGLYETDIGCEIAGGAGFSIGEWTVWTCVPTPVEGDDQFWYLLITDR